MFAQHPGVLIVENNLQTTEWDMSKTRQVYLSALHSLNINAHQVNTTERLISAHPILPGLRAPAGVLLTSLATPSLSRRKG